MTNETLETLKRSAAIPSLPQVVTRFLEVIRDPAFDFEDVADVLAVDPGMTADILRLVNSPLFGVTRKVASLHQALTLLGLRRVRSLVLGRYLVDSFGAAGGDIDGSYFWRRSLATAVVAAKFIDCQMPGLRDEAFIGGLLCDTGVIVLADALQPYGPVAEQYAPHGKLDFCARETEVVGITHAEVSAAVLEYWQLPEMVTEAVRLHHTWPVPDPTSEQVAMLARTINGSGHIARYLCETADAGQVAETCRNAMEVIGLEMTVLVKCLGEVENEIRELAEVLHIDIIPSQVYSLLADSLSEAVAAPAGA